MFQFLDKYQLIKGKTCWGVEMIFTSKDSYTLIATELITSKEGITVKRRFTDLQFHDLKKLNTKDYPIYLTISGRAIIYKKVTYSTLTDYQQLISKVIPNATLTDFEMQILPIANNECWVTIVRKELIQGIIKEIEQAKLFVVRVFLGPFSVVNVFPLLITDSIQTLSNEIMIHNGEILEIDSLGDVSAGVEYNFDGELINSHELVAFSTALNHFSGENGLIPASIERVEQMKQELLHKNKCGVISFGFASLFLLVVVLNLLFKNNIESDYNKYQLEALNKQEFIEELESLKAELAIKEQFIQNSGVTKASKTPYYVDQIALSVPRTIRLEQLFIHPNKKKINKAEDIHFEYDKIKVRGSVNKSIELNDWIKSLKEYKWITDISIIEFNQENLRTPGEFELHIFMKS